VLEKCDAGPVRARTIPPEFLCLRFSIGLAYKPPPNGAEWFFGSGLTRWRKRAGEIWWFRREFTSHCLESPSRHRYNVRLHWPSLAGGFSRGCGAKLFDIVMERRRDTRAADFLGFVGLGDCRGAGVFLYGLDLGSGWFFRLGLWSGLANAVRRDVFCDGSNG
jgi:hypothetical protein